LMYIDVRSYYYGNYSKAINVEFDVQAIYIIFQKRQNITQKVGNNRLK